MTYTDIRGGFLGAGVSNDSGVDRDHHCIRSDNVMWRQFL